MNIIRRTFSVYWRMVAIFTFAVVGWVLLGIGLFFCDLGEGLDRWTDKLAHSLPPNIL